MRLPPILSSLRQHKLTAVLLALQVAFACAIVCNAMFLIAQRVERVRAVTGLQESGLSIVRASDSHAIDNPLSLHRVDVDALRHLPGVLSAAIVSNVPLSGDQDSSGACGSLDAINAAKAAQSIQVPGCADPDEYAGGPETLPSLGLRLIAGRDFRADEYIPGKPGYAVAGATAAIISQALATKLFPGGHGVGQTVYFGASGFKGQGTRVVGVVAHLLRGSLVKDTNNDEGLLLPVVPNDSSVRFAVRSDPSAQNRVLKAAETLLASRVPGRQVSANSGATYKQIRSDYFQRDTTMISMLLASALGLLFVTAMGIAGLASFWVQQRTHQIGIRRAIGATRGDILRYFQAENFLIVSGGIALGLLLAVGLNLLLMKHYELPRLPLYYLPIAALVLWGLGQLAVLGPALRAAAVSPVVATRQCDNHALWHGSVWPAKITIVGSVPSCLTTQGCRLMKILPMLICATLLGSVTMVSAVDAAPMAKTATNARVASRVATLNALLAEQWQQNLKNSPEFATMLGDLRYNDRWSDGSLAHHAVEIKATEDFLKRFQAIDTTGFADSDKLNQQLMVRQLKDRLRGDQLKLYEMPLDQMNGVHLALAGFVSSIPFHNTKEYDDYLTRLKAVPALFDQVTAVARQGMRDKMMPPKYLLEKVVLQIDSIEKPAGMDSVFAEPLKHFPKSVSAADQKRLHDAILAAIDHDVRPAYTKLAKFVADDYAPHGRSQPGVWELPNGEAIYRYDVEQMTTTNETPQQIHEIGLAEVKRIEAEMTKIAHAQGFKDLASFRASLKTNPKTHATSREDILNRYRGYIAGMEPELPKLFGLLPKTEVVVKPVEKFREKEAAAAEYHPGTPDGSRPGQIFVNTGDFANRSILSIESTAYHEGIPGHHLQISIAQTLSKLPPFRQQAGYNAYIEGWALYAEQLGKEVGFYKDPLSDYGRLTDELLRADRLVLDTGVHYKHWTRQQMVDFFHAHSSEDEPDVQAETDRYITWPGQALAYKTGELKILQLRARAEKALGDQFDIRAFHDEVLSGGALPLDVLETRVDDWIAAVKAGTAPAHPVATAG